MKINILYALAITLLASCANTGDVLNKLPRAYSQNDFDLIVHKQYSGWSTYCQNSGGQLIGCATYQGDLTVYITSEGSPRVIIGGNDYHESGTKTCITIDGIESCLDNTETDIPNDWPRELKQFLTAMKGRWFMDKIFWDIEKAQTVSVKFMPVGTKTYRQQFISMNGYKIGRAHV